MRFLKTLTALLLLVLTLHAYASSDDYVSADFNGEEEYTQPLALTYPAFYLSFNGGYGKVYQPLDPGYTKNQGFAWFTNGGVQVIRQLAVEGGYIKYPTVQGPSGYNVHAWYAALKGIYQPDDSRFNVFLRLGAADTSRVKATSFLAGTGVSYFFSPIIAASAEFLDVIGTKSDLKNMMMVTLGLSFYIRA